MSRNSIKYIFLIATLSGCFVAFAQTKKTRPVKKETEDNLNKTDDKRQKQGTWFYRREALRGEPAYSEFGNYKDDRKAGHWIKLDSENRLISIENYARGVLNGESQYYENGKLICIGHYRGLNPDTKVDSVWITDPISYEEVLVAIPTERGTMKHGLWRYYDANTGQLTREEEYQVDDLIFKKDFRFTVTTDSTQIKKRLEQMPHNRKSKGSERKVKSNIY